ncbi:MAG TPA: Smr/MutS family protein [Caldimonas sp.]|nr:Smr/MutS family protein [Caldimonas sp.]
MKGTPKSAAWSELATLRARLTEHRRHEEALAAQAAAAAVEQGAGQSLFAESVGAVVPLNKGAAASPPRPRPPPRARQRERDEASALAESIADVFDAETLLETDDALSFRRRGIGPDVVRKLRRGVWALQDDLDLHGLRREEAQDRLAVFLREATRAGYRCVRVVHGKGHGSPGREPVLKDKVRRWLAHNAAVLAFTYARAADGGHGALIVLLRSAGEAAASAAPVRRRDAARSR